MTPVNYARSFSPSPLPPPPLIRDDITPRGYKFLSSLGLRNFFHPKVFPLREKKKKELLARFNATSSILRDYETMRSQLSINVFIPVLVLSLEKRGENRYPGTMINTSRVLRGCYEGIFVRLGGKKKTWRRGQLHAFIPIHHRELCITAGEGERDPMCTGSSYSHEISVAPSKNVGSPCRNLAPLKG